MATPRTAMRRPYVYRAYNAEGVLLYVGSTVYLGLRMSAHARRTRWWLKAKRFTFEAFETEAEARAAETDAIRSEFPRWNIRDRSPFHPDGYAIDYADVLGLYPDDCRWGMGRSPLVTSQCERRLARRYGAQRAA